MSAWAKAVRCTLTSFLILISDYALAVALADICISYLLKAYTE